MKLRRANPQDVDGIIVCIEAAYAGYRTAGIDLPAVSDGVAKDVDQNLVWVVEDKLIAGVLIATAGTEKWHLANLAVHPNYAGRGLARQLLAQMESAAQGAGIYKLGLTTHVAMPDNVAIYERLGWRETSREGHKVFMARDL